MSDFPTSILDDTAHRPWPLPDAPWVLRQTWTDLLFAHWPVDEPLLRACVPAALPLDRFDGRTWLGIVPFQMSNVAPRGLPNLPFISAFAELNVRTYVTVGGKPGVYFFSLDAGSKPAAIAARLLTGLPYFSARMEVRQERHRMHYGSVRDERVDAVAEFQASYGPTGPAVLPEPGTLDHFLTERYCLYRVNGAGRVHRLDIHHPRWHLQPAVAAIDVNTMAEAAGLTLPFTSPVLHFARRQDAVAWAPVLVRGE